MTPLLRGMPVVVAVVAALGIHAGAAGSGANAPRPTRVAAEPALTDSLRIYYVGKAVGWERFTLAADSGGQRLDADFAYTDRGRHIRTQGRLIMSADYSVRELEVARIADTTRTVTVHAVWSPDRRRVALQRNGVSADVEVPAIAFAVAPYTPLSQHLALLRYWKTHGAPATMALVPGGLVNSVAIAWQGADRLTIDGRPVMLNRYAIRGVVWGSEYVWLDDAGRLAMFAAAAGGLSTKGVRAELVPAHDSLMAIAARASMSDLVALSKRTRPMAEGLLALVGATLIDGSGRAAVSDATVIVSDGRIVSAGPSASAIVPAGARRIDLHGKTIVPGLWDMHAHLHQGEWASVYLAAGITTVRDMGNEEVFIGALRQTVSAGLARGPRILLAGIVDGPGPNAFGGVSASTPDEGRAIVRRYHAAHYEQVKLYDLLAPAVVAAICDEAHKLGMTVTGHVPRALTMEAAIDSGMDQIAHMPIRAAAGSDTLRRIIAQLLKHHTVIDPTASWGEIGGHSTAEPLQSFQPVTQYLPPVFMQTRAAGWGSATTDTATAHARLARTLAIIGELHRAGVPIVAGTDEGVPGFSVFREIELYAKAGMTPLEAIRAASAVPANAMRLDKDVGTIEVGKLADLLVLDANPLENISNIRSVRLVMKDGRLFESATLWEVTGFAATITDAEYEVYAAALDNLYYDRSQRAVAVAARGWRVQNDFHRGNLERSARSITGITDDVVQQFLGRNAVGAVLEASRFHLRIPVELVSDSTMAVVFGVADHLGYRRFYDRFPRTSGLVEVSRVGFNADDTMALMNARRSCGMDCADDSLLLLAKRAGRWAVVARLILSQS